MRAMITTHVWLHPTKEKKIVVLKIGGIMR